MSAVAPAGLVAHVGPVGQLAVATGVAATLAAYAVGARHGRSSIGRLQGAAAAGAAVALLASVAPPLADRAEGSFAWHMAQHLLLTTVVPPLVVLARPHRPLRDAAAALAPGAAARLRRAVGGSRRPPPTLAAAAVAAAVLWAWHVPGLYGAALSSEAVHAAEHLTLLASALAVWLLATHHRTSHLSGLAALLVVAGAGATLGGLLTFAPRPLYPAQSQGVDPLLDQQAAGLWMWVPGGMVPLAAAAWLAVDGLRRTARAVERRERLRVLAARRA